MNGKKWFAKSIDFKLGPFEALQLSLPYKFLRRWLKCDHHTDEEIDTGYPQFADKVRWTILVSHVIKSSGLKISVMKQARKIIPNGYKQDNQSPSSSRKTEDYADTTLQDQT